MAESAISVLIPTIGRPDNLRRCLESLTRCDPAPAEVLVVDQSGGSEVRAMVEASGTKTHVITDVRRGVGAASNFGLEHVREDAVAITHDDCTVRRDWVGVAERLISRRPEAIHTGMVEPGGEPWAIPSTIVDRHPRDFTGLALCNVLYPNNMVCDRARVLAFGGFDERFGPEFPAEDNDFCYRWLRSGRAMWFEPSLRVTHHDWRSGDQLRLLHRAYGRGQGAFYAKHLRDRDPMMLRFLLGDFYGSTRAIGGAVLRRRWELAIAPRARLAGLPTGIVRGWRHFRSSGEDGGSGANAFVCFR